MIARVLSLFLPEQMIGCTIFVTRDGFSDMAAKVGSLLGRERA
jgi:hypothetical protein